MPIFRLLLIILFLLISTFASQQNFNNSKQTKRQLKILVYSPTLSWSHAQFLGKIADTLVDAGHEVHFLKFVMDSDLKLKNETSRVNPEYKYIVEPSPENAELLDVKKNSLVTDSFANKRPFLTLFGHQNDPIGPIFVTACKETIKERKLLQKLEKEHFDVGIGENYDHCAAAIFHKIGVRVQVTAYAVQLLHWIARKYDIPTFASYVPNNFAPTLRLESFSNRLINFYNEFYEWIWMHDHFKRLQDPIIRAEFGEDFPDLNELLKKSSLVFVNTNPFIDFPRPISNKIVYIGGLVQDSASPDSKILDKRTKNILNEAKEGAILFSFGSITDTTKISNYMRNSILNAFKRFPNVHFIWKLDKETIKNQSELLKSFTNVHAFEWIRQTAILG
uniref:glucuronosyltransferase n=1 Tax=Meloidogyne incognita TaxID=6306 RepID=A0A914MXM1_MELIC